MSTDVTILARAINIVGKTGFKSGGDAEFHASPEVCVYLDVWNYFEDCKFGIEAVPHAEVLLFNLDLQLTIAEGAPLLLQVTFAHLEELHLPKTHKANHSWTAR